MMMRILTICFLISSLAFNAYAQSGSSAPPPGQHFKPSQGANQDEGPKSGKRVLNPYDPKYRPMAFPELFDEENKNHAQPFMGMPYMVSLVRPENGREGDFILRLSQQLATTGCIALNSSEPKIDYYDNSAHITVEFTKVGPDKTIKNPHFDCPQNSRSATTDIPLNHNALMEQDIRRIVLKSGFGSDTYTLQFHEYGVTALPQSSRFFKPQNRMRMRDPLSLWFYPQNTVILSVPQAQKDQDVQMTLIALADRKGLSPLEMQIPRFIQPLQSRNIYYFSDMEGIVAPSLPPGVLKPIGRIEVGGRSLTVMARRPRPYD